MMKFRKESILWNVMVGAGVSLLDSLRGRLNDAAEDLGSSARNAYDEASRRAGRASEAIQGEDHRGMSTAVAILIGIGVGVGVGMLVAPMSGEETRNNISDKVQKISGRMREKFSDEESPSTGTYGA
jgi:hypothetical protein